jgi:hypothetical protein
MQNSTTKDKFGNTPFKTINYRGVNIDFYDDDYGQSTYFYYKGELYNCGTYNLDFEEEARYIVDHDLDFIESITLKPKEDYPLVTEIMIDRETNQYYFKNKGGGEQLETHSYSLPQIEELAIKDMRRFSDFLNDRKSE